MPEPTRTVVLSKPSASSAVQTIRLGENLTDYLQQSTTEPMFTACFPVGAIVITENVYGTVTTPSQTHLVVDLDAAAGSESIQLTLSSASYEGDIVDLKSGDRLVFGSSSGSGVWSVEVKGDYEVTSYYISTTVALREPIPTTLYANTGVSLIKKDYMGEAHPLTLSNISNRTVTVDGVTYKKSGNFVYDSAAVARYGLKMMSISDSDRTLAADLLNQAIYELRQQSAPAFTIEINAVDMAYYTDNHAHLRPGEAVRVISEAHGLDEVMVVRKADIDLDDPGNTKYEIGKAMATATGMIRGAYGAAASVRERLMRGTR